MRIDDTKFGSITINGQEYDYDVYILPSNKIEKRNKKNSPRINGHRSLGASEIDYLLSFHPDILFIGKGQSGGLPFQPEAQILLQDDDVEVIEGTTPNILRKFNELYSRKSIVVAIFHITC
jgi:hypothetical protein